MSSERPRRLFIALWPPDAVRRAAADLARRIAAQVDGRRIRPQSLHLTLAFLGKVPPELQVRLEDELQSLPLVPHSLCLDRLGYWHRPQVVWWGTTTPPGALLDWVSRLQDRLAALALPVERRPFVPHMTLLRKVRRRPVFPPVEPVSWGVDGFVLVASHLCPEGARYEILRRYPALPPADSFSGQ